MKMPYGKHKGKDIETLPSSYLLWIAENWKEDTPQNKAICKAADEEYKFREKHGGHFEDDRGNDEDDSPVIRCPKCGTIIGG